MTTPVHANYVRAGQGEQFVFHGTERRMKLTGADSNGLITVYESTYPAERASSAPRAP